MRKINTNMSMARTYYNELNSEMKILNNSKTL